MQQPLKQLFAILNRIYATYLRRIVQKQIAIFAETWLQEIINILSTSNFSQCYTIFVSYFVHNLQYLKLLDNIKCETGLRMSIFRLAHAFSVFSTFPKTRLPFKKLRRYTTSIILFPLARPAHVSEPGPRVSIAHNGHCKI